MAAIRTVSTLCRMCDHGCGMDVDVDGGEPVAVRGNRRHPYNRGWLCAKGKAALDLYRSPDRLTTPLVRSDGELRLASWDEALSFSAAALQGLKQRHGPASVALYQGEGVGHQEIRYYMKRFANVFGTPNFLSVGSVCNAARTLGEQLTFGGVTKPDIERSRFVMVWGGNPRASHEPFPPPALNRLQRRGGQLAVVDPRTTATAARADLHLPVRPGQDEVLLLSLFHVIVEEGLWDEAFTSRWVEGFEGFFAAVREERFSPEATQSLTGVSPDLARILAYRYATTRPASLVAGNGIEHHPSGVTTARLLALLRAITGNLDVPGGDLFTPRPPLNDITAPLAAPTVPPIGADRFPLFCESRGEAHALALSEAILEGTPYPIKGMVIVGGNVTLELPGSRQMRRALEHLEFLAVVDVVRSPDCRHADVVLPACTFLERDEHRVGVYQNLAHIALRTQVVAPRFGLPDQWIWVELARHMGYREHFPWEDCRGGIDHLLGGMGLSYDGVLSRGGVHEYESRRYKKYESDGFCTPTGKVEVQPERLQKRGYAPSPIRPDVFAPVEGPQGYPLFLTTGANLPGYTHGQHRNISRLRRLAPEPVADIHPETGRRLGVADGDTVEVRSPHGSVRLRARLSGEIRPDTLHVPQGWAEANANELTSPQGLDPISGFPNLKSLRCNVERV